MEAGSKGGAETGEKKGKSRMEISKKGANVVDVEKTEQVEKIRDERGRGDSDVGRGECGWTPH